MASRKKHQPKKLSFGDIIKGNFLNREEVKKYKNYFLLISLLVLCMIYTNHLTNQKIKIINNLKEKTEEYKSRNAYAQSLLINVKMESELGKEMIKDSLKPLENHPHKLLIKIDKSNAE